MTLLSQRNAIICCFLILGNYLLFADSLKLLLGPCVRDSNFEPLRHSDLVDIICFDHIQPPYPTDNFIVHAVNDSFTAVLRGLADKFPQWVPDAVVWIHPEYRTFPYGIEYSPYPTVAVVGDWNIQFTALAANLQRFDLVLTDTRGVDRLRNAGVLNVVQWPQYTFHREEHLCLGSCLEVVRDIDVLYVGSINYVLQPDRMPYLADLAAVADRYRVVIATNVFGDEYANLLRRAKIVFNRSIRGELNMRAYEALAAGCLLFMEDSNLEVGQYFTDGVEYIAFNRSTFRSLIDTYLSDDQLRRAVAAAGQQRLLKTESRFIKLERILRTTLLPNSHRVTFPEIDSHYRYALHALQNFNRSLAWYHLELAHLSAPNDDQVTLARALIQSLDDLPSRSADLPSTGHLAESVWMHFVFSDSPYTAISLFNLAHSRYIRRDYGKAASFFSQLIAHLGSATITGNLANISLEIYPPLINYLATGLPFRALWEYTVSQHCSSPDLKGKLTFLLLSNSQHMLGQIASLSLDHTAALTHFRASILLFERMRDEVSPDMVVCLGALGLTEHALAELRYQLSHAHAVSPLPHLQLTILLHDLHRVDEAQTCAYRSGVILSAVQTATHQQNASWLLEYSQAQTDLERNEMRAQIA